MEAIKLKTHIRNDGILRLQLPTETKGMDCEVIVLYEPRRRMTQEEWVAFVNETYGSLAEVSTGYQHLYLPSQSTFPINHP